MQFTTLTISALLSALALAAPTVIKRTGSEDVTITKFSVRRFDTGVSSVEFTLGGDNATDLLCSASDTGVPSAVITCGTSDYRFALEAGNETDYSLRLYHQLGAAAGYYGQGDVPTYCRAGGSSIDDRVCDQVEDVVININADAE